MGEEEYDKLYRSITGVKTKTGEQKFNIGSYPDWLAKMQTTEDRRGFYDAMDAQNVNLGDYGSYEFRLAGGVKKKDQPEVAPSVSVADGAETSAVSPSISDPQPIASGTPEPLTAKTPDEVPFQEVQFITGEFGNAINSVPFLGDIIDDSARAIAQGQRQGAVVNDALNVMTKGAASTDEEVNTLISEIQAMSELGPSEEFQNFQKIATEEGGVFGFMKALANEPGAVTEVFLQSMSSLANKSTVAIAGAAAVPAMGIAGPAGVAATLPYVMAAGGAAMETGLTFAELLQEELKEKGVEFDTEGVRSVLEDEEAMSRIRGKSTIRGGVIGTIDALTGGLAVKVGAKMIRKGSKLKTLAAQSVVEGTGGGFGEAAATVAIGETPTVLDVGMEAVGGAPGAGATFVATAARRGKYRINGQEADRKTVQDVLKHATPKQLAEMNIEIKNDNDLMDVVKEDQAKAQISEAVGDAFSTEAKQKIVELEYEYQQLQGKRDTRSKKRRMAEIEQELDAVMDADKEAKAIETEGPVFEAGIIVDGPRGTETYSGRYEQEGAEVATVDGEVAVPEVDISTPIPPPPPLGSDKSFEGPQLSALERKRDLLIRRFQDKYIDIFRLQESVADARGKLEQDQDFRMAEELFYGKAADRLEKLDAKTSDVVAAMKEANLTMDQVDEYLYAMHAKERNARLFDLHRAELASLQEKMEKTPLTKKEKARILELEQLIADRSASGMTDTQAEAILKKYAEGGERQIGKSQMEAVHAMVMDIAAENRKLMVESGLMSQEQIDEQERHSPNYVPLQGFAQDERGAEAQTDQYAGGARGFSTRPVGKAAKGRQTEAANPLAQLITNSATIRIEAERNLALQNLRNLVEENPNSDIWKVIPPGQKVDPNRSVAVMVDGKKQHIQFADEHYAKTLKDMGVEEVTTLGKFLRPINNWLRRSFTTVNPEFILTNFARDIQSAVFNAMAEADIPGGQISGKSEVVGKMMKRVPQTLKGLLNTNLGRDVDPNIAKYYAEFKEDGGKTGWAYAQSLADRKESLQKELDKKEGGFNGKQILELVEGVNDAVENSIRLAAYIEAREAGVSREKAAQLAKGITVNFNKQGTESGWLNTLYLFFNASVQGSARTIKSLGSKKVQKHMAGAVAISAMLDMVNRGMSDEDEDGISFYDKISDYEKERNIIVMTGGSDYIKIPLPYGYGAIWNLGTSAGSVAAGARSVDEALLFSATNAFTSFSPFQVGGGDDDYKAAVRTVTPTALQPIADLAYNESYYGNKIYAEQFPGSTPKPKSEMAYKAPKPLIEGAKAVNRLTGGTKDKPGLIDFNPDRDWYVAEYYMGGAGKMATRTGELISDVAKGIPAKKSQLPFARSFSGDAKETAFYYDMDKYEEYSTEVEQLFNESVSSKIGGPDKKRYAGITKLYGQLAIAEGKIKKARNLIKAQNDESNPLYIPNDAKREAEIEKLREDQRKAMMAFNKKYRDARK